MPITPSPAASVPDLFGHPRGLSILFMTEMWERFSFYGMRSLLIFYLTKHFLFGDADASGIYAAYGSLVYLTPVIGGLIADRYLGFRRAIVLGALFLCAGHFGMAFEGEPARAVDGRVLQDESSLQVFYFSLALIIIGVGLLKPNISSIVGQLYVTNDPRRDAGFTLFYMGINLGAALATLLCGWLAERFGWAYGFGAAGVGMLLGLLTFVRGGRHLGSAGLPPADGNATAPWLLGLSRTVWVYLGSAAAVVAAWQLIQYRPVVGGLLTLTAALAVGGIVVFSFTKCDAAERGRMLVLLILTSVSVVFWALFEQAGSSMSLFTERNVDRHMLGVEVAPSQFQFFNPGFILLLAPFFSMLWPRLARMGLDPSTPAKFGLGVLQAGLGFAVLIYGIRAADESAMVAAVWLVLAYLLHTTGELCLSPVGLSAVTKLSVPRVVGLMMGVWFLASAFSHYVAGIIAQMASVSDSGESVDSAQSLLIYADTFALVAWIGVGVGIALLLVSPLLKRMMHSEPPGVASGATNLASSN